MSALAPFIEKMKQELAEELGQRPVESGRPTCKRCGGLLFCRWGRNSKAFMIMHPRKTCELEFDVFGKGETEPEAWLSLKAD